ncbi:electron transfer flavoprotein subunit beta/FixA family protein, partial [Burkholderia pseudomallei]
TANRKLASIAVLVSVGRQPVAGVPRYSRTDAAALEIGRALAAEHRARLEVIHAGVARKPALADYLAVGAACVGVLAW